MAVVRDRDAMVAGMAPDLRPGRYVFATLTDPDPDLAARAIATMAEAEGLSLILPLEAAQERGLDTSLPMRQITLQVHSALDGVGLTAAVATALAKAGIACNMVAGHHHDHAFVPADRARDALAELEALASRG